MFLNDCSDKRERRSNTSPHHAALLRRDAAGEKQTAGSWFHEVVAVSRCFVEHRRDVPGGDLWSYTACGFSRGQKSTFGSAGVWTGPRDGTQDVGLFDSAGLPAERASQAAQAGTVARSRAWWVTRGATSWYRFRET